MDRVHLLNPSIEWNYVGWKTSLVYKCGGLGSPFIRRDRNSLDSAYCLEHL